MTGQPTLRALQTAPPTIRVDVTGMAPQDAHTAILEHLDAVATVMVELRPAYAVAELTDHRGDRASTAAHDQLVAARRILVRHAPRLDLRDIYRCLHDWHSTPGRLTTWPCADYRDAAAGVAAGLPTPEDPA